jgi:DNA-binding CsgD family transcriptional regulator
VSDIEKMPVVATSGLPGRPQKYLTHVLPRVKEIYQWLIDGATDYSIADSLGISPTTLIEYKKSQDEIIEIYSRARASRCNTVQNAQFGKAKGIKETIKKPFKIKESTYENGKKVAETERIEYAEEDVFVPPDTNAAEFWSRHNDPDYIAPRSDPRSLTLIQNNFQLDDWQAKRQQILNEIRQLELQSPENSAVIAIEAKKQDSE